MAVPPCQSKVKEWSSVSIDYTLFFMNYFSIASDILSDAQIERTSRIDTFLNTLKAASKKTFDARKVS